VVSNGSDLPRIGLTTYVEEARWGVWDRPATLLPQSYVDSVVRAGGVPMIVPPVPDDRAARAVIDGLDALILIGGNDVDPGLYGADPHPETKGISAERDRWEIDLLALALDRDLPVLGICRGAQLFNIAFGGSLHQHVPHVVGHTSHRPGPAVLGAIPVRIAPDSLVGEILGTELEVPCYHHQSIDRLGDGITAVGWADDGTVEAVEVSEKPFAIAVQWHPEDGDDPRLFDALIAAARSEVPATTRTQP
jgi:gamma-glutamyl-gamma-aminobutyrate hydrolase PuuD